MGTTPAKTITAESETVRYAHTPLSAHCAALRGLASEQFIGYSALKDNNFKLYAYKYHLDLEYTSLEVFIMYRNYK